MSKNKKYLFGLVILAAILFLPAGYGQAKPEPKLLWQRSFEERIDEFIDEISITHDGSLILVNAEDKRYLINGKDGKIIRSFQEKRPSDNWVLSADGKEIIDDYGRVIDKKNKTLRTTGLNLLRDEGQYPLFSPLRKYVALLGNTMVSGAIFIEMYDLTTGRLLWEYKPEIEQGGFKAKFINEEKLAVYEYDKVRLVDVKTGAKFWEVEVFRKSFGEEAALTPYLNIAVSDSGDICISKWDGGYVTSVSRDGQVRWEKVLPPSTGGIVLSPTGQFLSIIKEGTEPIELYLINNFTGSVVWKRELNFGYATVEDGTAFFLSDKYLFRCDERIKDETVMGRYLHLWDVETGNLLWKWKPESGRAETIQPSGDKKSLLVRDRKNIYLFDISHLLGGGK